MSRLAILPGSIVAWLIVATSLFAAFATAQEPPDAPEARHRPAAPLPDAPKSYAEALAIWKAPEDIARFTNAAFTYDRERALALAETADSRTARPAIHRPEAMYAKPEGVCIDLARFGVETLNRLDASFAARYLMIEFDPMVIDGRTLRRHWIASFRRNGKVWFFADSRRPGHVAGPYDSVDTFIEDYARYRERPIVKWRETDSFLRATRTVAASVKSTAPSPSPAP
jgi:hypothetical protein